LKKSLWKRKEHIEKSFRREKNTDQHDFRRRTRCMAK
jgi:hypothetical protein